MDTIKLTFLLPGEFLLSVLAKIAPKAAAVLAFGNGRTVVVFIFAMIAWTTILILGLVISRFCRGLLWQSSALARTLVWRTRMYLGGLKTRLIWKYREWFPKKAAQTTAAMPTEFDVVDLALMRYMADQGPAITSSAPDLGHKFRLRPAQIQSRLEKLAKNNMVSSVIGSTDGFDNYRLTGPGSAFVEMWQKQSKSAPGINPVSASESG